MRPKLFTSLQGGHREIRHTSYPHFHDFERPRPDSRTFQAWKMWLWHTRTFPDLYEPHLARGPAMRSPLWWQKNQQEAQLMPTNLRNAFRGQVNKHSSILYVRYIFILLWNSNFVFKTCHFSNVHFQKWRDLEIWVRGHSRTLKVVLQIAYGFLLVFYINIVPTIHRFWDIRLQICSDLENWVRGPWRSL